MEQKLRRREIISYGGGDFACGMIYNFVTTYLFYFYSDILHLSLPAVSMIMVAGRGLVAVMDFFVGMLVDRTHTKYGSMRPYLLWFFIPLGILLVLMHTAVDGGPGVRTAYALVTYVLYNCVYALLNDPYTMLMSTITDTQSQRMRLNVSKMVGSSVGGILVMAGTLTMTEFFQTCLEKAGITKILGIFEINGFTVTALLYGAAAMVFLYFCFSNTRERVGNTNSAISLKTAWKAAVKNVHWILALAIGFLVTMALTTKVTVYYAKYVLGSASASNWILTLHMGASVAAVLCMPFFCRKLGKRGTFLIDGGLFLAASIFLWVTAQNRGAFYFWGTLGSFFLIMLNNLSVFIVFDTIDYTQRQENIRPNGFMFSIYCVITKISMALGAAIFSWSLERCGYVAEQVQGASSLFCIRLFYIAVPFALVAVLVLVSSFYRLEKWEQGVLGDNSGILHEKAL